MPPPEEQSRIVAKVDDPMKHCDQLQQSYDDGEKLLQATLKQLLN